MAEDLERNQKRALDFARRRASSPVAMPKMGSNSTGENKEAEDAGDPELSSQKSQKSRLNFLRRKASEKQEAEGTDVIKQQAEEKIKKEITQKLTWRAANMAMGATVILVFLTILVWTVQFIGGNLMGSKMIPKLGLGEIILWIIGLCIIFALFTMIMLAITLMIEVFEKPWNLVEAIVEILWKNFWSGMLGN